MSGHSSPKPAAVKLLSPGTIFLLIIMAAGAAFGLQRYIFGLGASTNLNNTYPWGIWKAINVAAVAAIGSSGFTMTALVHVFHKEKYHVLMRPSLVMALLCYTFVGVALLVDLGKYYFIWHPMLPSMWQPNSALFEVAMCVMCYLTVLYIEFAPVVFEKYGAGLRTRGRFRFLNAPVNGTMRMADYAVTKTIALFMILGIVLCCLHQSTLGTLMVIPRYKLHQLWHTPALPLLFLLSATAVGLASAVATSLWSSKAFGARYEMKALTPLARCMPIVIVLYIAARIIDLALRDKLGMMLDGSPRAAMFLAELIIGLALPCFMLLFERVRTSPRLLFSASMLFIIGVSFNRLNTYITAYMPPFAKGYYFPSVAEIVVCAAQVATLIFLYRVIVIYFPVLSGLPEKKRHEIAPASAPDAGIIAGAGVKV